MDFSSHLQAIAVLLVLLCLYKFRSAAKCGGNSNSKCEQMLPPEPAGALPLIGHLHQMDGKQTIARTFAAMADKYGPIFAVRLGTYRNVIISSHEAVKECYTTNGKVLVSRPTSAAARYLGYNYASFVFAPYGPYWREMRKIALIELLSKSRLDKLKHIFTSEVDAFIKDLYLLSECNQHNPTNVVITPWAERLLLNIVMRMISGKRYFDSGEGGDKEAQRIRNIVKEIMRLSGVFVVSDLIPCLGWMDFQGQVKSMKRVSKEFDAVLEGWIQERSLDRLKGQQNSKGDFIDVLLSVIEADEMYGHSRNTIIKATIMTMILGGTDTTSVTLTWILSNLLNKRQALKLAQEELDSKIGRDRWVQDSDIENLVYLQAVVKETLRLYPAAPISVPHEAIEDCCVSGYNIPNGTRVFVNLWKLHRDPRVWSNPEEFMPERFLGRSHAAGNVDVSGGQHFEMIPFGTGRRSCPGMTFALQTMHLTLARLLQAFSLTTPGDAPVDMTEGLAFTLNKATPLEVVLTPRLPLQLYQGLAA